MTCAYCASLAGCVAALCGQEIQDPLVDVGWALHDQEIPDAVDQFGLQSRPAVLRHVRLYLSRGPGPDFSERDRAVLTLLRPHLYQAFLAAEQRRNPVPPLTARQWELLRLLAAGHTNAQIARRLGISEIEARAYAVARAFPNRVA